MPFDPTELRKSDFPWTTGTAYLDSASIGPLPTRTRATLDAFNAMRSTPHRIPKDVQFGALTRARSLAARLLNVGSSEIALATNTSFGINIAARALPLGPGDIVLVSDREFPANVYPWMQVGDRGATLELVPVTEQGWPDEARLLERLTDPRVKVLAVSLVQFSNGYTVDLASLSKAARATRTWLVVDAIQGLGQLPVDLAETPVDILATGAQKWLLSPWGSGFFYVRKEILEQLSPPFAGWLAFQGTDDFSKLTDYNPRWHDDSRRFELITLPFQDFAAMNTSLELILDIGVDEIAAHLQRLHQPVLAWAERTGAPLASPRGTHGSGILCLAPEGVAEVFRRLKAARIICSLREGAIRLSPHGYNTVEEMERVAAVLDGQA